MSRSGKQIDAERLRVDGNAPDRLNRVGMKNSARVMRDPAEFVDGLIFLSAPLRLGVFPTDQRAATQSVRAGEKNAFFRKIGMESILFLSIL